MVCIRVLKDSTYYKYTQTSIKTDQFLHKGVWGEPTDVGTQRKCAICKRGAIVTLENGIYLKLSCIIMPHLISLSPCEEKYFSRSSGQSAAWYQCRRSIKCLWWDHFNNQRWRIWTCKPSCALLKGLAASQYVCYQTCHSGLLTMQHNPSFLLSNLG